MLERASYGSGTLAPSGLWVAAIGFFVTRFSVTLAAYETRTQFLLGGVVPLLLGLLLAALGVALAVGAFDVNFVRTVAVWCTAGTLAMAVMVVFTLLGTTPNVSDVGGAVPPRAVLSNFLIGGAVLGALTGLYAGQNRRNRAGLRRQANRLVSINRFLRHEVLNAVAVIRGRAEALEGATAGADDGTRRRLIESADHIVDVVEDLKYLSRTTEASPEANEPVDLVAAVEESVAAARESYPDTEFVLESPAEVRVWADDNLAKALYPIVENAAAYAESPEPTVRVAVEVGRDAACVRIEDEGPGLPEEHRATLERGEIPEFDDPTAGFGTNVARMFVEGYGGDIQTAVTGEGSTVEVVLALADGARPTRTGPERFRSVGVDRHSLLVAAGASLVAGAVMGAYLQAMTGAIPIIGSLYGVDDPLVGWITHEFHSVVFGLVYASLLTLLPADVGESLGGRTAVGVAWGLFLAVVAAGVVMPVWLTLVGFPSAVPSVSATALLTHLLWGVSLAGFYHLGETLRAREEVRSAAPGGPAGERPLDAPGQRRG